MSSSNHSYEAQVAQIRKELQTLELQALEQNREVLRLAREAFQYGRTAVERIDAMLAAKGLQAVFDALDEKKGDRLAFSVTKDSWFVSGSKQKADTAVGELKRALADRQKTFGRIRDLNSVLSDLRGTLIYTEYVPYPGGPDYREASSSRPWFTPPESPDDGDTPATRPARWWQRLR